MPAVRTALVAEAETLARHHARIADEGTIAIEPPVDIDRVTERFRGAMGAEPPSAMFVLEDDGQIIGYAGVDPTATGIVTFGMSVLPEARGKGGGRLLLEHIVDHARAHGCHKVTLEVWPDNARAISLYARSGFAVEGLLRDHYRRKDGSLRSALIMGLLL